MMMVISNNNKSKLSWNKNAFAADRSGITYCMSAESIPDQTGHLASPVFSKDAKK